MDLENLRGLKAGYQVVGHSSPEHISKIAKPIRTGGVDQVQSESFASIKPWVQSPNTHTHTHTYYCYMPVAST
jgi:hypothetical protein